jgi:hypothetical protein
MTVKLGCGGSEIQPRNSGKIVPIGTAEIVYKITT